ncbi:RidA family protein [Thermodesulfobacteriota bacterium]
MKIEIIETPTLAKAYAPYSPGVKVRDVGSFIFIAGVVPNDVDGNIICKGDIKGQMQQVLKNLKVTLEAAGATFDNVIKVNTYIVADYMKEYVGNKVDWDYLNSFPTPSDTLIGVACLANEDQLVEVEALAVIE